MSTLDEARQSLQSAARGDWRIVEATEALARAIFHDETEKAEAERRQKLDDLKRSIGVPVFADPATSPTDTGAGEADRIADLEQRLAEAEQDVADNAGAAIAARMERDAALAFLEKAEKRIGELAMELQFIDNLVEENIRENGGDQHRMLVKGEWHSGPAVDACHRMLRGIQKVVRAALTPDAGTARSDGEGVG